MSTVFYTSDLHIGHRLVAEERAERAGVVFPAVYRTPEERQKRSPRGTTRPWLRTGIKWCPLKMLLSCVGIYPQVAAVRAVRLWSG